MKILNLKIQRHQTKVRGITLHIYTDLGQFGVFIFRLNKRASLRSASHIVFNGTDDLRYMPGNFYWSNKISC